VTGRVWVKRSGVALAILLLLVVVVVSVLVQLETDYRHEVLSTSGSERALVLYHPSRDASFSDDLSTSVAQGFQRAGLIVERATITRSTPPHLEEYAIVAVVSNTYYWTPDLPTLRYLRRARLPGVMAIGLMGGAGSTGRAERLLAESLTQTGAESVETRSFWLWRPNDEARTNEPNREVAMEFAELFGYEVGASALAQRH
jgi:hypothetical protein